jgi:hypothetical protein
MGKQSIYKQLSRDALRDKRLASDSPCGPILMARLEANQDFVGETAAAIGVTALHMTGGRMDAGVWYPGRAGYYSVSGCVAWDDSTGAVQLDASIKSTGLSPDRVVQGLLDIADNQSQILAAIMRLQETDGIYLNASVESAGTLTVLAGAGLYTYLNAHWIGDL